MPCVIWPRDTGTYNLFVFMHNKQETGEELLTLYCVLLHLFFDYDAMEGSH